MCVCVTTSVICHDYVMNNSFFILNYDIIICRDWLSVSQGFCRCPTITRVLRVSAQHGSQRKLGSRYTYRINLYCYWAPAAKGRRYCIPQVPKTDLTITIEADYQFTILPVFTYFDQQFIYYWRVMNKEHLYRISQFNECDLL